MGGGTGTGAAPVIARTARDMGILTVGVVTKPFQFEGMRRMRIADLGIEELHKSVDTLIVIPNQNLFRVANEKTTFADAFSMADQVLYSGVACITDLMVREGLINLDFADVRAIMRDMGKAMMGTGEATGERRAILAAEAAIANPLLDEVSMKGAKGLLISITGGNDLTLYEVDEAASRIRQEVDEDANIILGATFDVGLEGVIRVSVVATGIDKPAGVADMNDQRFAEAAERMRAQAAAARQRRIRADDAPGRAGSGARGNLLRPGAHAADRRSGAGLCPAARSGLCAVGGSGPGPDGRGLCPAAAPARNSPMRRIMATCSSSRCRRRPPPIRSRPRPRSSRAASRQPMFQAPFVPPAGRTAAPRAADAEDRGFPDPRPEPAARLPRAIRRRPGAGNPSPHPAGASRHLRHEPRRGAYGRRRAPFRADRAANGPADRASRAAGAGPAAAGLCAASGAAFAGPPRRPEYAKRPPAQRPAASIDAHGRGYPRPEDDQLEIPAFLRRQSN